MMRTVGVVGRSTVGASRTGAAEKSSAAIPLVFRSKTNWVEVPQSIRTQGSRCAVTPSAATTGSVLSGGRELEKSAPTWAKPDEFQLDGHVALDNRSIWRTTWWPVGRLAELKDDEPNATQLLGMDLVLWKDATGTWCAARDECPHRFARMSVGRLDQGVLECRSHGWAFDGTGKCIRNPQAETEKARATTCKSKRSCLRTFPTMVVDELLFVFPQEGEVPPEHAAGPTLPEKDSSWGSWGTWTSTAFPIGYAKCIEHGMDPSHGCFTHDEVVSPRLETSPMSMKVTEPVSKEGYTLWHGGYTNIQKELEMTSSRTFAAPGIIHLEYGFNDGQAFKTFIYFVPAAPNKTLIYGTQGVKGAPPIGDFSRPKLTPVQWLIVQMVGDGLYHTNKKLGRGSLQEFPVLNGMEYVSSRKRGGWREGYYATASDLGVVEFNKWLERYGGGRPDWEGGEPAPTDLLPLETLFSPYELHAKDCPICKQTIAACETWNKRLLMIALALIAFAALLPANDLFGIAVRVVPVLAAGAALYLREEIEKHRQNFFHQNPWGE
eukprot:jgi/Botrbrau1/11803/Bobra.0224s0009.1